jgi:deoxycytidylate deaminase
MQEATLHSIVEAAAASSTCRKRSIVCVLYDAANEVVSVGRNQCSPPEDGCPRLGVTSQKQSYTNNCNPIHAEEDALRNLPSNAIPIKAVVYGHDFVCSSCEHQLRQHGISDISIQPDGYGTGLRN